MHGRNPLRPQEPGDGRQLWVQEVFYTLQGEGPFSGQPAVFVRLAGCNLNCWFCDTEFESSLWKPTLEELIETIGAEQGKADLVVITGGEPFRQNIGPLVEALLARGLRVQIETNGTLWIDLPEDDRLFIVCSPKTERLNKNLRQRISAYKYLIAASVAADGDGPGSVGHRYVGMNGQNVAEPEPGVPVYVMPLDEGEAEANQANLKACSELALSSGHFLTVQTHKILGIR